MPNLTNRSQQYLTSPSFDVVQAIRNLVYDIQEIATSAGDLSSSGSTIGAVSQVQVFTNGTQLTNLTASRVVVSDGSKTLVSSVTTTAELALLSGKTAIGDVTGAASSITLAVPLFDGITGKVIQDSALIGTVAGSLTIPAAQKLTTPEIAASADLTLTNVVGTVLLKSGVIASVSIGNAVDNGIVFGTNTVSIVTSSVEKWMVNSSGALNPLLANTYDIGGSTTIRDIGVGRNVIVGGIVSAAVGAVGAPSYAFTGRTTNGMYSVSATQTGFAIGGVLMATIDSGVGGFQVAAVGELVGGVGVAITGTGGNIVLMQNVVDAAYILIPASTADHACLNLSDAGVDPTTPNVGDVWYDSVDEGLSAFTKAGLSHITLVVNTGWTIHTGTGAKAAFDADATTTASAGYVQVEVQAINDQLVAVQKALAGIQDHLMTNMDLLQA